MTNEREKGSQKVNIVLLVPGKHVKTVKTALERSDQLDRSTKISPEASPDNPETKPTPAPILKFDPESGQYVDPGTAGSGPSSSNRDQTIQLGQNNPSVAAILKFDPITGQYVHPSSGEQEDAQGQSAHQHQVPLLQFDLASGQYVDPAVLAERRDDRNTAPDMQMRIATTISCLHSDLEMHSFQSEILDSIGLAHLVSEIGFSSQVIKAGEPPLTVLRNPLHKALREAFETTLNPVIKELNLMSEELVSSFPESYSIYKPMLLLPHNAFSAASWQTFLSAHSLFSPTFEKLWPHITSSLGTTHIAINSPIPAQTATSSSKVEQDNILRSPINLTPLYGDFGTPPTHQTLSAPTPADFARALWVSTTQNGIQQTWAPLYTMFSRGNIREKTRILHLPSVARDFDTPSSSAVDLYAGIGYFAFCYKKAGSQFARGIRKVLGFELNPWSVEGLRRGAQLNGWSVRVFKDITDNDDGDGSTRQGEEDFYIFQMSNDKAVQALDRLGPRFVAPVRHVNLGLLPSSEAAWETAVKVLDAKRIGWIHVHENVAVGDVEARSAQIKDKFQTLVNNDGEKKGREVEIRHVERVKMYAPGVVHCVFDVQVAETE